MNDLEKKVGNTPLLHLKETERVFSLRAKLFAKMEAVNPGGSVKDRAAKAILDDAEKDGRLQKGGYVVEATSGNTGIGLALVARSRGYKTLIVMPETMSIERRKLLASYGAELVLTDGAKGMQGAVEKAEELVKNTPNAILAGQFENPANVAAHYLTTGPEIYRQTGGQVDIFVAGVGTGGTLTGVGKYLKKQNKNVQIIAVEPSASPLLSKGVAGAHGIQGIGANFIPKILDVSLLDDVITVDDEEAKTFARYAFEKENAFVGISSGAALYAAIELAKREENAGKTIVTLFPDSGDRYGSILGESGLREK